MLPRLAQSPEPTLDMLLDSIPAEQIPTIRELPKQSPQATAAQAAEPRTPTEELVGGVWAQVLGLEHVGLHDQFFDLGGHSLLATQVISRLRETFQVNLSLRALFEQPTVTGLARTIDGLAAQTSEARAAPPLRPVPRDAGLPLSFAQQRLWFLYQLAPQSAAYNTPAAVRLGGALDIPALRASLRAVMRRHEILRTRFTIVDGNPVQVADAEVELPLPTLDLSDMDAGTRDQAAEQLAGTEVGRPFDLTRGPLLRLLLLRLAANDHLLVLTMHHIVSDAWSVGVLIREVGALYAAFAAGAPMRLADLPIQYADFAHWQRGWLQGEVLENQVAYWRSQLGGALPTQRLPTDRPAPSATSDRGARHPVTISATLTAALVELSRCEGVTLFMALLTAFDTLLHYLSGQEDILVGSPIANRNRTEIEGLIGFFVNTLVLRTDLSGNPTFRALLRRVRDVAMNAYLHQDLPFDKLVEVLRQDRGRRDAALFRVWFVLQNAPMPSLELPGLALSPFEFDSKLVRHDLSLGLSQGPQGLSGWLDYRTDLFDATTIARIGARFEALIEQIVAQPEATLAELVAALAEADRQQQLQETDALEQVGLRKLRRTQRAPVIVSDVEPVKPNASKTGPSNR